MLPSFYGQWPIHIPYSICFNPLQDELLGGIVVVESLGQLAQLLDSGGLVVALYLLLGVVAEGELDGLHGLLQVGRLSFGPTAEETEKG